jgi:hypothetical protein
MITDFEPISTDRAVARAEPHPPASAEPHIDERELK